MKGSQAGSLLWGGWVGGAEVHSRRYFSFSPVREINVREWVSKVSFHSVGQKSVEIPFLGVSFRMRECMYYARPIHAHFCCSCRCISHAQFTAKRDRRKKKNRMATILLFRPPISRKIEKKRRKEIKFRNSSFFVFFLRRRRH